MNEIELAEGVRAGEDTARKELYTIYARQLLAVCYRYTGDMDAAHDVLHDGFIKIFTHFSFRGECALGTWLTRVMATTAIDYLRRQQRFEQMEVHEAWAEEQAAGVTDEDENAEATRLGAELSRGQLMELIARLPEGCRMVFNLYVFEEKSHREIAQLLGIREHSSTSQLSRAKALLARMILDRCKNKE